MVGALLLRGMCAGIVAGVLCFGFLKLVGEPPVDRAIAFEEASEAHQAGHAGGGDSMHGNAAPAAPAEPALVSRQVQAGIGLFTAVAVYSAAFGGLFALAFALAYGRIAELSPRATAAVLATLGFVAVYAVPGVKYPANPPSVGAAGTIGTRTMLYFAMIALSLAAAVAAGMLRTRLRQNRGDWNATLIAAAAYAVVVIVVGIALPTVDEVPADFPATALWQFRIAALGGQLILWGTLGLLFGALTERVGIGRSRLRTRAA